MCCHCAILLQTHTIACTGTQQTLLGMDRQDQVPAQSTSPSSGFIKRFHSDDKAGDGAAYAPQRASVRSQRASVGSEADREPPVVTTDGALLPEVDTLVVDIDDLLMFNEDVYLDVGRVRVQRACEKLEILRELLTGRDQLDLLDAAMSHLAAAQADLLGNISAHREIHAQIEEKFKTLDIEEAAALEHVLSYASVSSPRNPHLANFLLRQRHGRRSGYSRRGARRGGSRGSHRRSSSAHDYERALEILRSSRGGKGSMFNRVSGDGDDIASSGSGRRRSSSPREAWPASTPAAVMLQNRSRRADSKRTARRIRSTSVERGLAAGLRKGPSARIRSWSERQGWNGPTKIKHTTAPSSRSRRRELIEHHDRRGEVRATLHERAVINRRLLGTVSADARAQLSRVDSWDEFDVWALHQGTDGNPLSILFMHLVEKSSLFSQCHVSRNTIASYIRQVERGYNDNPYHNKIHAADVLHATHYWLQSSALKPVCDRYPLLRLATYVAAAVHDYKHPGTNNAFARNSGADVALTYNDISVLENMHVAEAFRLTRSRGCDFLAALKLADRRVFRKLVISLVLQTDMAKHTEIIRGLQVKLHARQDGKTPPGKWFSSRDPKLFLDEAEMILGCALHCADLSNPCKPRALMTTWAHRIVKEFWRQGDLEKVHMLPVGPGNDRNGANVPLGQQFFIRVLVSPLYIAWQKVVPEAQVCLKHLKANLDYWVQEAEREKKSKSPPPDGTSSNATGAATRHGSLHHDSSRSSGRPSSTAAVKQQPSDAASLR